MAYASDRKTFAILCLVSGDVLCKAVVVVLVVVPIFSLPVQCEQDDSEQSVHLRREEAVFPVADYRF